MQKELGDWVSKRSDLAELGPAPLLAPLASLLKSKRSGWTKHHQNALRAAILGCYRSQEVLFQAGEVDTCACPLCGSPRGNSKHILYACPGLNDQRELLTGAVVKNSSRDICHKALEAGEESLLWTKALRPDPSLAWGWTPPTFEWRTEGESDDIVFGRWAASDGSLVNGGMPAVARAGWAVSQVNELGVKLGTIYGPCPWPRKGSTQLSCGRSSCTSNSGRALGAWPLTTTKSSAASGEDAPGAWTRGVPSPAVGSSSGANWTTLAPHCNRGAYSCTRSRPTSPVGSLKPCPCRSTGFT